MKKKLVKNAQEVRKQISELEEESWKLFGIAQIDPNYFAKVEILDGKIEVLKWVLGEEPTRSLGYPFRR